MNYGAIILVLIPAGLALVILNCVGWVLVRLQTGGLPVRMGMGWPWTYYTYEVNRVGPSHFDGGALLMNVGAGVGMMVAAAVLAWLITGRVRRADG